MSDLTQFTDAQIREELRRRAEEEERQRKQEVFELVGLTKANINKLLEFIPVHERTTCSDAGPSNADRACNRCIALRVRDWGEDAVASVRLAVVR